MVPSDSTIVFRGSSFICMDDFYMGSFVWFMFSFWLEWQTDADMTVEDINLLFVKFTFDFFHSIKETPKERSLNFTMEQYN